MYWFQIINLLFSGRNSATFASKVARFRHLNNRFFIANPAYDKVGCFYAVVCIILFHLNMQQDGSMVLPNPLYDCNKKGPQANCLQAH